ncbi:amidohydrolase family protein (plasmid) [Paraburkholderia sprentiae WSM5005]|uniref:Amidohydrolase family protein n=1 Tax=Paraburkholderia sprentiae WSM5005 TaxID=754502 RepID=A0A1I9YWD9_9BURK|nr:amidohydrolase family protein [Paraburkholderia sprentiae]APA90518.1 amidohydrolase family protein [Paraburkholderia sprentiae WSM5005]
MILDFHTHLLDVGHWPAEWWDHVARGWAAAEPGREPAQIRDKIEAGLIDPDGSRMIADMDAAGVDAAVVLPIDWGPDFHSAKNYDVVVDHAIECQHRYPGRLIAFGGIDPRRPGAPEKVDAWLRSGQVHGLKLYPNCGWMPAAPEAMAVYEVCQAHDAPILFHTGHPLPLLDESWSRLANFMPVVEAFPKLKAVLGHAGAPCEFENALNVAVRSEAATLELSVCLWDDHNEEAELALAKRVAKAIDVIGAERILFGTDHVSGKRVRGPGFLTTLVEKFQRMPEMARASGVTISDDAMERIMGLNGVSQLSRYKWRALKDGAVQG